MFRLLSLSSPLCALSLIATSSRHRPFDRRSECAVARRTPPPISAAQGEARIRQWTATRGQSPIDVPMTTEDIAATSGASKATICNWWPTKYAVAVEAFLSQMAVESADPDTG